MKPSRVTVLLLLLSLSAWANEIHHQVERASDLERELAYTLSVQDKHDVWRAHGLEKVFPIQGPSPEYTVRFHATATGRLKEVFGLALALTDEEGIVLGIPLALRTKWHKEDEVSVEFLIRKDMIAGSTLTLRCGLPNAEESYTIRLADYAPKPAKP